LPGFSKFDTPLDINPYIFSWASTRSRREESFEASYDATVFDFSDSSRAIGAQKGAGATEHCDVSMCIDDGNDCLSLVSSDEPKHCANDFEVKIIGPKYVLAGMVYIEYIEYTCCMSSESIGNTWELCNSTQIIGNPNHDCSIGALDVQFILLYVAGKLPVCSSDGDCASISSVPPLSSMAKCDTETKMCILPESRERMDLDMDGIVSRQDANILGLTLVGKSAIIAEWSIAEPWGQSAELVINVTLANEMPYLLNSDEVSVFVEVGKAVTLPGWTVQVADGMTLRNTSNGIYASSLFVGSGVWTSVIRDIAYSTPDLGIVLVIERRSPDGQFTNTILQKSKVFGMAEFVPWKVVNQARTDASTTQAMTDSLHGRTGWEITFDIQSRDEFGNARTVGGDTFSMVLIRTRKLEYGCPSGRATNVTRLANCSETGCLLQIAYNDTWGTVCDDIFGLEEIQVACGSVGLDPGTLFSGRTVSARDSFSGPIWLDDLVCAGLEQNLRDCPLESGRRVGKSNCNHYEDVYLCCKNNSAVTESTIPMTYRVAEMGDGKYQATIIVTVSGSFNVWISVNREMISGMPIPVEIFPGAVCTTTSDVRGAGLSIATVGICASFTIQARDEFGNKFTESNAHYVLSLVDNFDIISDPACVEKSFCPDCVGMYDMGDGTISMRYFVTISGSYFLHVNVSQSLPSSNATSVSELIDSSWEVIVYPGSISAFTTQMFGPNYTYAGQFTYITIFAIDPFGNSKTVGGDAHAMKATIVGPSTFYSEIHGNELAPAIGTSIISTANIEDYNNGTYRIWYVPTVTGRYQTIVTIGQLPIQGSCKSPCVTVYPPTTDVDASTAIGSGLSVAIAGSVTTFSIIARDIYTNPRTKGGDTFDLEISRIQSDMSPFKGWVVDNNDGTYNGYYIATLAGNYLMEVAMMKHDPCYGLQCLSITYSASISGSPFAVRVLSAEATDPDETHVHGVGVGAQGMAGSGRIQQVFDPGFRFLRQYQISRR